MNSDLLAAISSIPAGAVNATIAAVTTPVTKLLTTRSKMEGGWELPSEFTVVCANIDRDPDTYEESEVALSFQRGKSVTVSCNALLIVPGKAIIGIVSVDQQEMAVKVPHVTLVQNDFKQKRAIANFVNSACGNRGPF